MKKLFISLCTLIAFTMISLFCFSSCSPVTPAPASASENDWVEVAEITYYINGGGSNPATLKKISPSDHPVKIRFLEDNCLEIQYGNKTIRVLPLSYEIVY